MVPVSCKTVSILGVLGASLMNLVLLTLLDRNTPRIRFQTRTNFAWQKEKHNPIPPQDESNVFGETNSSEWVEEVQLDHKPYVKLHMDPESYERPWIFSASDTPKLIPKLKARDARLVMFSMDVKIAPIFAVKHVLVRFGVGVFDESLSPNCDRANTCSTSLSELSYQHFISLSPKAIHAFQQYSRDNVHILETVDAFLCVYPLSLCELYLPFNKSIILLVDGRYELGRSDAKRWGEWTNNVRLISADKMNIIAATNQYDIEYIRHFVGIEPLLLPYNCDYITDRFDPQSEYKLIPIKRKDFMHKFVDEYRAALSDKSPNQVNLSYPSDTGDHSNQLPLSKYKGFVVIPHQVSFLAFTEYYRMNIPLFLPSMELLVRWHHRFHILQDRSLVSSTSPDRSRSNIKGLSSIPDPNDDTKDWAIGFWMQFADFYMLPNIQYFTSAENLADQLCNLREEKLISISAAMKRYNNKTQASIEDAWSEILSRLVTKKLSKSSKGN